MTMDAHEQRRYRRAPVPVHFPTFAEMPESKRHLESRTTLYQILKLAFADRACIGCDQFVYWDPTDPKACLAPDAFLRLGAKDELFASWKVWERGAPHLAVEVVSIHDSRDEVWERKFDKYRRLGVRELVLFDLEAHAAPLRVWDAVDGDLVERELILPRRTQCGPLELSWVVVDDEELGLSLRLADSATGAFLPTPAEAERERAEAERERARAERERARAERERGEIRIRALEEELARLKASG